MDDESLDVNLDPFDDIGEDAHGRVLVVVFGELDDKRLDTRFQLNQMGDGTG